jgi:hypothetical protein
MGATESEIMCSRLHWYTGIEVKSVQDLLQKSTYI